MIKECHLCGTKLEEGDFVIEGVCRKCEAKFKELERAHAHKKFALAEEISQLYENINESLGNWFVWVDFDVKDMEGVIEHYKAIWAKISSLGDTGEN